MSGNGVQVEPPSVRFTEVRAGQVHRKAVTVTNVGKNSKKLRLQRPTSELFGFKVNNPTTAVAPGLSVSGTLEFTPEGEEEVKDHLLLHIDEQETVVIPIQVFPQAFSLLMDSVVNFGSVTASSQVICKQLPLTNQGSAPGTFLVQYSGDPSVRLSPSSGTIPGCATQWLTVELCTNRPRRIQEEALVKPQNGAAQVLSIRAEVVDHCLELYNIQGAPLSCLWFGPIYFGTTRVENVVLRNNGPQTCDWISLLQDTAAGTEVGTDLQKSTDAAMLATREKKCSLTAQDPSQVLLCLPNQGQLGPYGKVTLAIYFSPLCKRPYEKRRRTFSVSRQDYSLFLLFELIGSKHGFTHKKGSSGVELAVTGSGLPVSLVPSPSYSFNFLSCKKGQRVDLLCMLQNHCHQLPVNFHFRKKAHFSTEPSTGTISPGQCQDVVLSFTPRQLGSFRVRQKLDILGDVSCRRTDDGDGELCRCSFHTITLYLSAICCAETTHPEPKLNPGITPAVTNPTGSQPHVRSGELAGCSSMVRAAVLCAAKTHLHKHGKQRNQTTEGEELVAFPNDRAASIRPASPHTQYRTIFTGVGRYHYVDPDYSFTKEEEDQRRRHRQIYLDFIETLRQARLQNKERDQGNVEDDVDIGIVPAQGLVSPQLLLSELQTNNTPESKSCCHSHGTPQPAKNHCSLDMKSVAVQTSNGQLREILSAVPSTRQEVADCSRTLTPQELYNVVLSPLVVDFGEVCVQSESIRTLELANCLPVCVWVQLKVDCPELQRSSPLSHILLPLSHTTLPLMFQSNQLGNFSRPISYTVNQQHPGQVLVQAQVVPVALELSTTRLVLSPNPSLLVQSEYRSSITLRNQRNHAADFTWRPVVTDRGILFSIRPATGTVEAYKELDCEVVWQPSFSSPLEGIFDLCVHEGNTQRLHCIAKVGSTSVQLSEGHLKFGSVPLNLPSIRTVLLHNIGKNHAYYQVLDVCPLPGMVVTPSEGVVPMGGQAVLKILFSPNAAIRFDTRVEIALRKMKSIELRVGGSVVPPQVDISVSDFQFHGVHAGSKHTVPFTLVNRSSAAAQVTFDLTEYTDFSISFPQHPAVSIVELQAHQTMDCSLDFSPDQVASYDFRLPLTVNGVSCDSPAPPPSHSLTPTTSTAISRSLSSGSSKCIVTPESQPVAVEMWSRRVQATVLCAPVEMSPPSLQFHMEPLAPHIHSCTQTVELRGACAESVSWGSTCGKRVHWWFDCSAAMLPAHGGGQEELLTVSPASGSLAPGQTACLAVGVRPVAVRLVSGRVTRLSVPLYLVNEGWEEKEKEEERHHPYRELCITIVLHLPTITLIPPRVLLTPLPLGATATAAVTLWASAYPSGTSILAEVGEVELEDGRRIEPLSVIFPQGNTIPAPEGYRNSPEAQEQNHSNRTWCQDHPLKSSSASLSCTVSFCSVVPVSLRSTIIFIDHLHNRFQVEVCAAAENCLLTVWPYMALHQSNQQIVLKNWAQSGQSGRMQTTVEAVLQCCHSPSPVSGLTSSSSSSFVHLTSLSKNSASDSFPDSNIECESGRASGNKGMCPDKDLLPNQGIPIIPAAELEEGLYYQNVSLAAQRWFTFFGWPNGPHPISVPHTVRRVVSKIQTEDSSGRSYRVSQNKDSRSVVDMLHHLTGTQLPGIPCCQSFSKHIDRRTNQLLQQYQAMLAFLRVQGASLPHIRPEYLLDAQEFSHWCSVQVTEQGIGMDYSKVDYESMSERSWTDVLLQIYKVLVLRRVLGVSAVSATWGHKVVDQSLPISSEPLSSNIYSEWELHLLSWLNTHYQGMRNTVWGEVPSARWIVNFDLDLTDGLVLAALVAAYCPYLINSHFRRMYTRTTSLEQILCNNIILVQTLTMLSLNIDIKPIDLSDPNPVQMLMLCVHLYESLPQYLPRCAITLSGGLHSTFSKQVHLKSPSSKPLQYQAFIFGEKANLFSLPSGSVVTIRPKASTELEVQYNCSSLQPTEAVLLLTTSFATNPRGATLAFTLKTHVTHITLTKMVMCKSPCYQMKLIHLLVTNPFNTKAEFRVVLVESRSNPLDPEKRQHKVIEQASLKTSPPTGKMGSCVKEEMEVMDKDGCNEPTEFFCLVKSVCLKPGQTDTIDLHYLPFHLGDMHCSVLLVCPEVGDIVYLVRATAELPLPSPLTARPSANIAPPADTSGSVCDSVLSLRCKVGQRCEEVVRVPLINVALERALAAWGQSTMSPEEQRRRMLTHTLDSSTVRAAVAVQRLVKHQALLMSGHAHRDAVEYSIEVSIPEHFVLPHTVILPIRGDSNIPQDIPTDSECVEIPLRFQANSVGQFRCQLVLRSWRDIRVYLLEAMVTTQGDHTHLDFNVPAHQTVTQDIPLGKLSLVNDCDGTEHTFTLKGVGVCPLPQDHVILRCPVGQVTHAQLQVPNCSQKKLTLQAVTDLSIVSGPPSLVVKVGQKAPYTLAISPWKRGKHTGNVSFVAIDVDQESERNGEGVFRPYEVYFSLELICEPAPPFKVIDIQCAVQSSVAIEIPVSNPHRELLMLEVCLEGEDLSGANLISVPSHGTLVYKVTFSPVRVGRRMGGLVFQSKLVREFWYQLQLYAVPPPTTTLPQVNCQLGKWTRQTIPLVNPTAETLELAVANSNPRNFTLEMDMGDTVIVAPHSTTRLGVQFRPSSLGEGNHTAQISFTCPQLKQWCFLLSGFGLKPESEEPMSISSVIGSHASVIVPFINPTEYPGLLSITLTDENPSGASSRQPIMKDKQVFRIPLEHTQGVLVGPGAGFDVPVVFVPDSMEPQQAWLCITQEPVSSTAGNTTSSKYMTNMRPAKERDQDLSLIRWVYPLHGNPKEEPTEPQGDEGIHISAVGLKKTSIIGLRLTSTTPEHTARDTKQDYRARLSRSSN